MLKAPQEVRSSLSAFHISLLSSLLLLLSHRRGCFVYLHLVSLFAVAHLLMFLFLVQVRGSFPSAYDCSVGYTLGLLSGMLAVSPALQKLPSAAVLISNPTSTVTSFSPVVVPLPVAAMACGLKPSSGATGARRGLAAAAAAGAFDIQLHTPTQNAAAAAVSMQLQQQEFLLKDTYLNSGPIQFHSVPGAADADRECNFLLSKSL